MESPEAASLETSAHEPVPAAPPLKAARRPFGRGRPVSLFTLGTMRALASPGCMETVLRSAIAAGINHLETAPAYGPAETFLGQALAKLGQSDPAARASLVITSKVLPGADGPHGRGQLAACLRRLGLDRLDNLAVHGLNTPEHLAWATRGPGAEMLAWATGEGLVGQVGFSSHGETALIEAALASGRFSFCSLHLHLFDQERVPLARIRSGGGAGGDGHLSGRQRGTPLRPLSGTPGRLFTLPSPGAGLSIPPG
jgi:predicted aldo/keto reductase-like oxidoreductase